MFQVDPSQNCLHRLEARRFSDLALRERDHLQEWLAKMPEALGEELLIIQKEFDGFADTRERLDLLALDKDGRLVVIENKLDDSGRDVTWQALKYTAYVSSLTKAQIVEIYQAYLDRYAGGGDARALICEFLDEEELDEVFLNPGSDQRVIFIAANFRKEVTATVLWLLSHGIRAQCFKVTPYSFGEELLIDLQQIIPPPEAADFMIGIAAKESEEKSAAGELKTRDALRLDYWGQALEALREAGVGLFQNISPSRGAWISTASAIPSCHYALLLQKYSIRIEYYLNRSDREENKWIFERLIARRDAIEDNFGSALDWRRLETKKACRIKFEMPCEGYQREKWPEYIRWHVAQIQRFEAALKGPLSEVAAAFKARGMADPG